MPAQQSVMKDRDESAPTASHGRDLPTLLSAAAHYAPHVRSEAVTGLAELARAHPKLVSANLRVLCKAAAERFNDPDDEPRAAGRALASALAAQVAGNSTVSSSSPAMVARHCGETALQPFEPLLVAHLGSALTSLDRAVRLDGLLLVTQLLGEDPASSEAVTAAAFSTSSGATSTADASNFTTPARLKLGDSKGWLRPLLPSVVEALRSTGAGLRDASQGLGALGASGRVMLQVAAIGHKGKPSSAAKASGLVMSSGSTTSHRGALARMTALRALVSLLSATTPLATSPEQPMDLVRKVNASSTAAATPALLFRRVAPPFTARTAFQANASGAGALAGESEVTSADVSSSAASAAAAHAAAVLAARGGIAHRGSLAASDAGALWEPLVASLQAAWTEATSAAANKHGGSTTQGAAVSLTAQSLAECALVARAAQFVVEHLGRDMLLPLLASARNGPTANHAGNGIGSNGVTGSNGVGAAEAEASRLRDSLVHLVDGLSAPPFFPFAAFAGRCPVSMPLARALDGAVIQAAVALALAAARPMGMRGLPRAVRSAAENSDRRSQLGGEDAPGNGDSGESDDGVDDELDDDVEASAGGQPSVAVAARRVVAFLADSLESDSAATASAAGSSNSAMLLCAASDVLLAARARGGSNGEPRLVLELQSGRPLSREAKQRHKQQLKKKRRRAVVAARQAVAAAEGGAAEAEAAEDYRAGGNSECHASSLGAYASVDLVPLRAAFEAVFLHTRAARVAVAEGPSAPVKCAPLSARAARRAAAAAAGLARLTHCAVVLLDAELERDVLGYSSATQSDSGATGTQVARKRSKRNRRSQELLSAPARRWCGALPAALTELAAAALADAPTSTSAGRDDKVPGQSEGFDGMKAAAVALRGLRLLTTLCRRCSLQTEETTKVPPKKDDGGTCAVDGESNGCHADSRAAQAAAMLAQLGPAMVPFFARVWPALAIATSPTAPSELHALWTAGLHLVAALADAGALDLGSCPGDDDSHETSGTIGDALDGGALLFLPFTHLRWALEALHHGRRHHTPSALLGRLLRLADAACASAEDAIDASTNGQAGTGSTQQQQQSVQPWSVVAALDERLVEISRALQLAGGAKLLRGTSPNLCAWLDGGDLTDTDMTSAFGATWLRPRAALLLLRGAAAPALAHHTSSPVQELPEPLQSVAAVAMVRLAATALRAPSTSEASGAVPLPVGALAEESTKALAPRALLLAPLHACLDSADSLALLKPFLKAAASHLRLIRPAAAHEKSRSDAKSAQQLTQRAAAAAALISTLQAVARTAARRPATERPIDQKATWKALATAAEETTADTSLARVGREFVSDVSLFFG